jgi:glutathione-regulated potassium-efflux system ancillary protein KefC
MNTDRLIFATAAMIVATAIAIGVAKKLNLGSIVALLLVGMALGPHSPRPLFTGHVDQLQAIGQIGVMFLIFVVALDIQPSRLWSLRRLVLGLGSLQFLLTTAAVAVFVTLLGTTRWQSALVVGLGLAMSSDAIPLPILDARGESATPEGRVTIAVSIFQSLMVIPVLALTSILGAGTCVSGTRPGLATALHVVAAISGVYLMGRYLLPRALVLTARNLGSGAFGLIVLAAVLVAGLAMSKAGVSMALGAFMIGVLLSTTAFAEQVKAAATPTKQILLGLFFIAIGMDIDLRAVATLGSKLLLLMPLLFAIKFIVVFGLVRAIGVEARKAMLAGMLLMPFDEIAYVIFANAKANGLLSPESYAIGLTMISLSFAVSPILINLAYDLSGFLRGTKEADHRGIAALREPAVVVGYGPPGRALCFMLERAQIAYIVFETDLTLLREAGKWRHNVQYGDISDPRMMGAVAIDRAKAVIVTTSSSETARRLIANLRHFYPSTKVLAAVPSLSQRDDLRRLGASEVMALLPEGTLSFGRLVLASLGCSAEQAGGIISSLQTNDYAALRDADTE